MAHGAGISTSLSSTECFICLAGTRFAANRMVGDDAIACARCIAVRDYLLDLGYKDAQLLWEVVLEAFKPQSHEELTDGYQPQRLGPPDRTKWEGASNEEKKHLSLEEYSTLDNKTRRELVYYRQLKEEDLKNSKGASD